MQPSAWLQPARSPLLVPVDPKQSCLCPARLPLLNNVTWPHSASNDKSFHCAAMRRDKSAARPTHASRSAAACNLAEDVAASQSILKLLLNNQEHPSRPAQQPYQVQRGGEACACCKWPTTAAAADARCSGCEAGRQMLCHSVSVLPADDDLCDIAGSLWLTSVLLSCCGVDNIYNRM